MYDITFVSHIISLRLTCHLRVHTTALPTNSHRCIINDCSMIASFFLSAAYFAKHEGTLRNSSLRQGRVRHLENCFPASSRSSGPRQLSTSPETRKTSLRVSCKSSHTLRICPLPNLVGNCNRYRCQCRCYRSPTSLSPSSGFQEGMYPHPKFGLHHSLKLRLPIQNSRTAGDGRTGSAQLQGTMPEELRLKRTLH